MLLGLVLSDDPGVTWSTKNHTTIPVLVAAEGPGSEACRGLLSMSDVHAAIAAAVERAPLAPSAKATPPAR